MSYDRIDQHLVQHWHKSVVVYPLCTAVFTTLLARKLLSIQWTTAAASSTAGGFALGSVISSRQVKVVDKTIQRFDNDISVPKSRLASSAILLALILGTGALSSIATRKWPLGLLGGVNVGLALRCYLAVRERNVKVAATREAMGEKLNQETATVRGVLAALPQQSGAQLTELQNFSNSCRDELEELCATFATADQLLQTDSSFGNGQVAFFNSLDQLAASNSINHLEMLKPKLALAERLRQLRGQVEQALASKEEILSHTPALQTYFEQGRADLVKIETIERQLDALVTQPMQTWEATMPSSNFDEAEFLTVDTLSTAVRQHTEAIEQIIARRDELEAAVSQAEELEGEIEGNTPEKQTLTTCIAECAAKVDQLRDVSHCSLEELKAYASEPLPELDKLRTAIANAQQAYQASSDASRRERVMWQINEQRDELQTSVSLAKAFKSEIESLGLDERLVRQNLTSSIREGTARIKRLSDVSSCSLEELETQLSELSTEADQLGVAIYCARQIEVPNAQATGERRQEQQRFNQLKGEIENNSQCAQNLCQKFEEIGQKHNLRADILVIEIERSKKLMGHVPANLSQLLGAGKKYYNDHLEYALTKLKEAVGKAQESLFDLEHPEVCESKTELALID